MRGKILFVAGAAVGYVLGARAGRKRYEQIASAAQKVWNTEPVQGVVHTAEDFAKAQLGNAADKAIDTAKGLVGKAFGTTPTPAETPIVPPSSTVKSDD